MNFEQNLADELARIEAAGLRRSLRKVEHLDGARMRCDQRELVNFSSNDYLGFAFHPALRAEAARVLEQAGSGAGASRLICGNQAEHEQLDEALARFKRTEAALSFSSGYAAALGTIPALMSATDVVILDKLCHASLVDGTRLSGAIFRIFPHNDLNKLESHLNWAREKYPESRILVVVESVYSMDGDRAPLREMVELKERYGAWLFVDEAHGVGVVGQNGRGLADHLGVSDRIEVQMGTLGKALGSVGAYICGSGRMREFLINRARSFIFSTALPAHCAAASRAAVKLLETAEGEGLRQKLWQNLAKFSEFTGTPEAQSAIFPLVIGEELAAVAASRELQDEGFFVPAIRYPTVARGAARLRLAFSANHEAGDIQRLADSLRKLKERLAELKPPPK